MATDAATYVATNAASNAATFAATRAATDAATFAAINAATYSATDAATDAATYSATRAATESATSVGDESSWSTGLGDMRALVRQMGGAPFWLACASHAWKMRNGGNQWSGWVAHLSFFRHVVQLPLDYQHWQHYEAAAILGGPRYSHAEFCIVSDRPVRLMVDAERRPHCADGPFCAWSDGTALWAWHGVYVPARVILGHYTVADIQTEPNAEIRRAMIERMGWDRYLIESGATPVQCDRYGDLYRTEVNGATIGVVVVTNSTPEPDGSMKRYALVVPPEHGTAHAAVASTFGLTPATYAPLVET